MRIHLRFLAIAFLATTLFAGNGAWAGDSASVDCLRSVLPDSTKSKTVTLFQDNKPVKNYNDAVESIQPGDTLQFANGKTFKVQNLVGAGLTTKIYDLGDGWVLRIPAYSYKGMEIADAIPFIKDFQEMQPELKRNGIPVVEMDTSRNIDGQAVVAKKEPFTMTLASYLEGEDNHGNKLSFKKSEQKEVEKKFIQFARTTWMYGYIGDFNPEQVGYNGKEWLLFDFGANNGYFDSHLIKNLKEKDNAFTHFSKEPLEGGKKNKPGKGMGFGKTMREWHEQQYEKRKKELRIYGKVNDAIADERKAQKKTPEVFKKIQKAGVYQRPKDES